ncbi:MAG: RNA polymerase sigma factor [Planctomycetota bacterium]
MRNDTSEALVGELRWLRDLAMALARGDAQLADDLVQDGAVALLEQRLPVRSIRAWLTTVVQRRAMALRTKKSRQSPLDPTDLADPNGPETDQVAERLEAQQRLNAAVLALPEPYRTVVVGHHLDDLTLAELARQRGVSGATVRQQHRRALAMLRQRLDDDSQPDGHGWRTAVAPLLIAPSGAKIDGLAAGTAATTTGGLMIMKKLLAVAAALLCVWWSWQLLSPDPASLPADPTTTASAAASHGELPAEPAANDAADPHRESAAVLGNTAAESDLMLTVASSGGTPIAGAVVHCGPQGQPSRFGMTHADGTLQVAGWQQAGEVWVWARNRAPFRQLLPTLQGEHSVVLPDGPVVEGTVTVDGQPPGKAIVLTVHWRAESPRPELPQGWGHLGNRSPTLEEAIAFGTPWGGWLYPNYDWRAIAVVEPSGRFELRGAQPRHLNEIQIGWRGSAPQGPYRLMGPDNKPIAATYKVPTGHQALHIDLLRAPSVRARLVFPDGRPVAGGRMQLRTVFHDGSRNHHEGGLTDAQGRIDRALLPSETGGPGSWWQQERGRDAEGSLAEYLELRVAHPDAAPTPMRWTRTQLAELERGRMIDLGTVVVQPLHRYVVQIVDPKGSPTAGIQALLQADLSQPTDANGRTTLELTESKLDSIWVAGPGWSAQKAKAIGGKGAASDPLRLQLTHRANRLVIAVPDSFPSDGLSKLRFGIDSEGPIFPPTRHPDQQRAWGPAELHKAAGGTEGLSWRTGGDRSPPHVMLPLSESREIVLVGLSPGVPVTAWLEDPTHQRLAEVCSITPEWGEEARIELAGTPSFSTHRVRVLLDGQPARNTVVCCRTPGNRDLQVDVDESGECQIRLHASGRSAELIVAAPSAVLQRMPIRLLPGTHSIDITLEPATPLAVCLTDRDGAPVRASLRIDYAASHTHLSTARPWAIRKQQGTDAIATRHVLRNAPAGSADLAVLIQLGGQTLRRVVQRPLDGTDAQLSLPRPQTIHLRLPDGTIGQNIDVRWRPEGDAASASTTCSFAFGRDGWQPATVELLPGRYDFTLHRQYDSTVSAQGKAEVDADCKELRLDVALPAMDW